jgi:hypothetical protein
LSTREPFRGLGNFGLGGPVPRDLAALIAVLFITYSLQFFESTGVAMAVLRIGPLTWHAAMVWQVLTYPFVGWGAASLWFPLQLLILYWFGRDVFAGLGRRHFWRLIAWCTLVGGLVAILTDVCQWALGEPPANPLFPILQGQQLLIAIFVTAFATANRQAQILLFFILPIQARFFIAIEVVIAFILFLETHDLPGFLGLCAAIAIAFVYVRDGGIARGLRQSRLRLERWWLQRRLAATRRRRGFRVVPRDPRSGSDDWLH